MIIIIHYYLRTFEGINYSACRFYTIRKNFNCKKCRNHLVSFIKHDGLFVPYIVVKFFNSKIMVNKPSIPTSDVIQEIKKNNLTRKSWFKPPSLTESKSNFKTGSAADLHRATRLSYTSGVRVVPR